MMFSVVPMSTPHKARFDAESENQLLQDLGLQSIKYAKTLQTRLDREAAERLNQYRVALASAAIEHERVLRNAERAQERLEQEIIRARHLEEISEQEVVQTERQAQIEREITEKRKELEERRQVAEREACSAKARLEAEEEDQTRYIEEEKQRLKDELCRSPTTSPAEHSAISQVVPVTPPSQSVLNKESRSPETFPNLSKYSAATRDAMHLKYLDLHKKLKEMRKHLLSTLRTNAELKHPIGDMRRQIKKSVGQLTQDSTANRMPLRNIRNILFEARSLANQPMLNATTFIISQPLPETNSYDSLISAPFVYLLNVFAKAVIAQFISEASVAPKTADPIGIVAITIFANSDLLWQNLSLIDILLAKFHVVCPVLFAVSGGNENTASGRRRLGWWKDEAGDWIEEQLHCDRMTGLGSGFAALSLRDFGKSASVNPYPPRHYWSAIAGILNLREDEITQTHCVVLRAMIEHHISKFVKFFGQAAVALLRVAIIDFPEKAGKSVASTALATLKETIKRDHALTL